MVVHEGRLVAHPLVCPHKGASLANATLDGGAVVCPWHGYRFDVKTGERRDVKSPMRLASAPRVMGALSGGSARVGGALIGGAL